MMLRVIVSSTFNAPADHVWRLVRKSSTLVFVSRGLLGFAAAGNFPTEWKAGDTHVTRLLFFGVIPAWKHTLFFSALDDNTRTLATEEGGGLVRVWNHIIQVTSGDNETCTYTDKVELEAGILTPVVWLFAQAFYRYRQYRWRLLLRQKSHDTKNL